MNSIAYLLIVSTVNHLPSTALLTEKEGVILSSLVSEMEIRFCIFVTDRAEITDFKRLSAKNIATAQLKIKPFMVYLFSFSHYRDEYLVERAQHFSTAFVFKQEYLDILEFLMQTTEFVGYLSIGISNWIINFELSLQSKQHYVISRFTWFVFLDDPKIDIFSYDWRVMLTTEFIIIQAINDDFYKLTEIYKVKNKSFSFSFGSWYGVLNVTNMSFDRRRSDLNGSIITSLCLPEYGGNVSNLKNKRNY